MPQKKSIFTFTCIIALIFILCLSIIPATSAETIKPEEAITSAFIESGAEFRDINVNSYVVFEGKNMTIDNIKKICNDIAERLNLKKVQVDETTENNFSQIIITGLIDDEIYTTLIVQSTHYEDFKESTIVLDIIDTKGEYDLRELCDTIRKVLSFYGEATINITLSGSYQDKLSNEATGKILENIFEKIGADKIEGIDTSDLVSITGYTPRMIEHLSYAGKKANINIALRYNSYENKTNIWIGTPIIVTSY